MSQSVNDYTIVFDLYDFLKFIFWAIVLFIATIGFLRHFIRKEWRLYKNLQREILIITPSNASGNISGKGMEMEIEKLEESKLFNISKKVSDYRNFNPQNNHCLVILGYDKTMDGIDEILTKIKNLQIPLIVYTYGENVTALNPVDKIKIDNYPWALFANFKLTLLNSVFNTIATYPYGKRKN